MKQHFHRQRHSPYRRRSPRRTHCLYSSSMQMWNDGGHIRTHPLSCRFSAGCIPRHSALCDVVRCGLSAAGIPSMLEPSVLDRGDGDRPDGITVNPYSRGRCIIWDATWVNTFASSNLIRAALDAGSVATPLDPSPTPLDPSPTPLKSGKSPSTPSWADASSSSQLLS